MATISIIIPAYNVQNNIYVTLNSLFTQNDQDIEIILIDDGSKDNTLIVVQEIMSKSQFKNFKIINKPNGGVSSARNIGIFEATGDYIYFLDGDDYVSNDMVSTVKQYICDGRPDVIAWGYNMVREDKSIISKYFDLYNPSFLKMTGLETLQNILLRKSLWIWTCSAIYKKDFIVGNNFLYTENCSNGEDQEFIFKVLSKASDVWFINKVLSFYVHRDGSISNSYNIKKFDAIKAFDRTANYLRSNLKEDVGIVEFLEHNHLIENFLGNYYSCIKYLISERSMSNAQATNYLMNEINKYYPSLNDYVRNKIKTTKNLKMKNIIKYKSFLISPLLYIHINNYYIKLINRKW